MLLTHINGYYSVYSLNELKSSYVTHALTFPVYCKTHLQMRIIVFCVCGAVMGTVVAVFET